MESERWVMDRDGTTTRDRDEDRLWSRPPPADRLPSASAAEKRFDTVLERGRPPSPPRSARVSDITCCNFGDREEVLRSRLVVDLDELSRKLRPVNQTLIPEDMPVW